MNKAEINGLVISLIKSELLGEKIQTAVREKLTADVLPYVFSASKSHDLANIVGDALIANGIDTPCKVKSAFEKQQNLAVLRYERMRYELEEVCKLFDSKQIEYIPLKGAVIRRYYPRPQMRTSCDIDILINKKDVKSAVNALVKELNFKKEDELVHDVSLFSPGGVHFELHFKLSDGPSKWEKVLLGTWKEKVPYGNHTHGYEMTNEYLLAYLTAHNAKHFLSGGCGIRPFADMFLLTKKLDYDKEKLRELLKECELETFWERQQALAEYWFSDGEGSELILQMQEFIFDGGVYGTLDNQLKTTVAGKQSRVSYIFKRVFPPFPQMQYLYPILGKMPFLYPFCAIIRLFKFFIPSKRKRVLDEFKRGQVSQEQKLEKREFLDQMGL